MRTSQRLRARACAPRVVSAALLVGACAGAGPPAVAAAAAGWSGYGVGAWPTGSWRPYADQLAVQPRGRRSVPSELREHRQEGALARHDRQPRRRHRRHDERLRAPDLLRAADRPALHAATRPAGAPPRSRACRSASPSAAQPGRRRRRPHDRRHARRLGVRLLAASSRSRRGGGTLTLRDRRAHARSTATALDSGGDRGRTSATSPASSARQELAAGAINHALFVVLKCTAKSDGASATARAPSVERAALRLPGDARRQRAAASDNPDLPPIGARFQLAMSDAQIAALPCPAWKKTILTALAHYGGYVGDTGGPGFGLLFESGATYTVVRRRRPARDVRESERPAAVGRPLRVQHGQRRRLGALPARARAARAVTLTRTVGADALVQSRDVPDSPRRDVGAGPRALEAITEAVESGAGLPEVVRAAARALDASLVLIDRSSVGARRRRALDGRRAGADARRRGRRARTSCASATRSSAGCACAAARSSPAGAAAVVTTLIASEVERAARARARVRGGARPRSCTRCCAREVTDRGDIVARGAELGIDLARGGAVVVVRAHHSRPHGRRLARARARAAERGARASAPGSLAAAARRRRRPARSSCSCPDADDDAGRRVADAIVARAAASLHGFTFAVGHSRVGDDPVDLYRAGNEALLAANVAEARSRRRRCSPSRTPAPTACCCRRMSEDPGGAAALLRRDGRAARRLRRAVRDRPRADARDVPRLRRQRRRHRRSGSSRTATRSATGSSACAT